MDYRIYRVTLPVKYLIKIVVKNKKAQRLCTRLLTFVAPPGLEPGS